MVWTVMLALGAWRLARDNVLTRQPQAVEALGATTVLCVDKTGTLTCNRMEVAAVFDGVRDEGKRRPRSGSPRLLRIAALASMREGIEPMDQAIFRVLPDPNASGALARCGSAKACSRDGRSCARCGARWRAGRCIAIKGAPEAVLARCSDPRRACVRSRPGPTPGRRGGRRVIARGRACAAPTGRRSPATEVVARPGRLRGSDARRSRRGAGGVPACRRARRDDDRRRGGDGAGHRPQGRPDGRRRPP